VINRGGQQLAAVPYPFMVVPHASPPDQEREYGIIPHRVQEVIPFLAAKRDDPGPRLLIAGDQLQHLAGPHGPENFPGKLDGPFFGSAPDIQRFIRLYHSCLRAKSVVAAANELREPHDSRKARAMPDKQCTVNVDDLSARPAAAVPKGTAVLAISRATRL
jgi:hypothetical protein